MHWLTTIASTEGGAYGRELLVILGAAAVISVLGKRLHIGQIPAYLISGALIGPSALGLIRTDQSLSAVQDIAGLAIILLMFTIGLHLDMNSLRSGMVRIILVGVVSTLAVTAGCWGAAILFGVSPQVGLVIGMAVSMSSTAVVLGLLNRRREMNRVYGRLCLGISLVQDLISVAVLASLPAVAAWADVVPSGASAHGEGFGQLLGVNQLSGPAQFLTKGLITLGGVGVMIALGKFALPKLLREITRGGGEGGREAMLVVCAAIAMTAAVITNFLELGTALGSFLAGFLLASTPFKHQVAGQLSPMRDLFLAVFFTAVGVKMNLGVVVQLWWVIGLAVIVLMVGKSAIIAVCTWAGGGSAPVSVQTGLAMGQAGEFSLVIVGAAAAANIVNPDQEAAIIALVVLSLILAPMVFEIAPGFAAKFVRVRPARWIADATLREPRLAAAGFEGVPSTVNLTAGEGGSVRHGEASGQRRVIIAGFGVVGRNLAEHFGARGIPFTVIELNPSTVRRQQMLGRETVFGDISNPDVLESAGLREADAVVLTIPDDDATMRACKLIREMNPTIFIAARTSFISRAIAAMELGADEVTIEEVATANEMARQVLAKLAERRARADRLASAAAQPATSNLSPTPPV